MKITLSALLILLFSVSFYAQLDAVRNEQKAYSILDEDGCIKPEAESQTYGWWRGKIVKIISANKVVLDQKCK